MLETTDLACERGGVRLFAGLAFTLGEGSLLRVRGPNGSGKTSLLRILAGLTRPAEGAVRWRGQALGEQFQREMVYIGHASAISDDLTVLENLQFILNLFEVRATAREQAETLQVFGLERVAHMPARFLSQGQRRRAALARLALSRHIPLWLLDEPFAALDGEAIEQLSALATAHLAEGGLLVFTSHQEVPIAAAVADTLVLPA